MRTINKILVGVTIAGAGFATIGAGAGADFVDSPSAQQAINTGTLLIGLSGNGHSATGDAATPASLALPAVGPTNSSFNNTATITATNNGSVTGTISDIELATGGDVTPLAGDASMTVYDQNYSTQLCSGTVAHCTGVNLTSKATKAELTLAPGATYTIHIETYAGGNTGAPALSNIDEGKTLNEAVSYTVNG